MAFLFGAAGTIDDCLVAKNKNGFAYCCSAMEVIRISRFFRLIVLTTIISDVIASFAQAEGG